MAKDAKLVEQLKSIREEYFNKANPRFHYDTFFKNSFESKVYTEITEKNLFKGERLGFIYNLRLWLGHISPNSSASENLDTILRYTQNGYTKEQMIYFLFKVADWIDTIQNNRWVSNYENHFTEGIGDTQIDNLLKLKSLIHLTLNHLIKSPITISQIEDDETDDSPNAEMKVLYEKQLGLISEVTSFLLEKHYNSKKIIMDESEYQKLINYIKDLQHKRRVDYGQISLKVKLSDIDIYYTMYLVNLILENNNNDFIYKSITKDPFHALAICLRFDSLSRFEIKHQVSFNNTPEEFKTKLEGKTPPKKFSTRPLYYHKLNPSITKLFKK